MSQQQKENKRSAAQAEIESQLMYDSMNKRRKSDALLALICPNGDDEIKGIYERQLKNYCESIKKLYERQYELIENLTIEDWIKRGIQSIIDSPDRIHKLALIFYTLSKEQAFAEHFVPRTHIIITPEGNTRQVYGAEPKVNPTKFRNYMRNCLMPLTRAYLSGEQELTLEKYVHRAALGWVSAPSATAALPAKTL